MVSRQCLQGSGANPQLFRRHGNRRRHRRGHDAASRSCLLVLSQAPSPAWAPQSSTTTGKPLQRGQIGELALTVPSIGLTRGLWRAPERYIESYWSKVPGMWIHGDFASIDLDGPLVHPRPLRRYDKDRGKRTGPSEVEDSLLGTGKVGEAAVIGVPDPIKGSAVVCVCVPARGVSLHRTRRRTEEGGGRRTWIVVSTESRHVRRQCAKDPQHEDHATRRAIGLARRARWRCFWPRKS